MSVSDDVPLASRHALHPHATMVTFPRHCLFIFLVISVSSMLHNIFIIHVVINHPSHPLTFQMTPVRTIRPITTYLTHRQYASHTLLALLLDEKQLLARLRSVKSLFFLERGDFFQQFMDAAGAELQRPARECSLRYVCERLLMLGCVMCGVCWVLGAGCWVLGVGRRERERETYIQTESERDRQTEIE
jgi:hypothetical protein